MTDVELIAKLEKEESRHQGFDLLVRKYQQRIYWHIRNMVIDHDDADDLVQDVFIKVWHNIHKFRKDASLYTWIYRIATNECLNFMKKKKHKYFLPLHDVTSELIGKLNLAVHIDGNEIQLKLQKAVLQLPNKQRIVFNMKYFDNMKFKEIAEITNTSIGALKANYHHAVKKIEEYIKEN